MNRCVNIDWLEVYCHEPQDTLGRGLINREYLESLGFIVSSRDYGTPLYHEVLFVTVEDAHDIPIFEVRRNPRHDINGKCVVHLGSCHIRMTNLFCYTPTPIVALCNFLLKAGYMFQSIKRIDICLDFNKFDTGEDPIFLIDNYMRGKLSKINQGNVAAHGSDMWDGRRWNSLKWGSPSSNITTKLYNKTLEMKQQKPKTYIQDVWKEAGLKLDIPVWRVEFAIKAGAKGFKNKKTQDFYKMKLSMFNNRDKLLYLFHSLCQKYFHFKYLELDDNGKPKRKDRCRDKKLFVITKDESAFEPTAFKGLPDINRMDKIVMRKCYEMTHKDYVDDNVKEAAQIVADFIGERLYGYVS